MGEIDPREIRIAEEELQQETTADPYYYDAILESWSNGSSNIHYSRSHAENDHVLGLPVPPIPSRKRLATHNLELFPYLEYDNCKTFSIVQNAMYLEKGQQCALLLSVYDVFNLCQYSTMCHHYLTAS